MFGNRLAAQLSRISSLILAVFFSAKFEKNLNFPEIKDLHHRQLTSYRRSSENVHTTHFIDKANHPQGFRGGGGSLRCGVIRG